MSREGGVALAYDSMLGSAFVASGMLVEGAIYLQKDTIHEVDEMAEMLCVGIACLTGYLLRLKYWWKVR